MSSIFSLRSVLPQTDTVSSGCVAFFTEHVQYLQAVTLSPKRAVSFNLRCVLPQLNTACSGCVAFYTYYVQVSSYCVTFSPKQAQFLQLLLQVCTVSSDCAAFFLKQGLCPRDAHRSTPTTCRIFRLRCILPETTTVSSDSVALYPSRYGILKPHCFLPQTHTVSSDRVTFFPNQVQFLQPV